MSIIKNKIQSHFSVVANGLITDTNISAKAYRVMSYLLSLPDGWEVNNTDVCKKLNICEDIIAKYWKELIKAGWITRYNAAKVSGRFTTFEYHLNEVPTPPTRNLPTLKTSVTEETRDGETTALTNTHPCTNTNSNNNTDLNKKNIKKEKNEQVKEENVQEVIEYFNTKTNSKFVDNKETVDNLKKVLRKYTVENIKQVIDYVVTDEWYILNNQVRLSVIVRHTKFGDKLERAKICREKPIKKPAKYSDVDTFTMEDSGEFDTLAFMRAKRGIE